MKLPFMLFALTWMAAGCSGEADADVHERISGAWVATGGYAIGGAFEVELNIARSGEYVGQIVSRSQSGEARTNSMEGSIQVEDGILIDTMTKHSNTNAPLPISSRARIVRIDHHEMVLKLETSDGVVSPTNDVVFRRIER